VGFILKKAIYSLKVTRPTGLSKPRWCEGSSEAGFKYLYLTKNLLPEPKMGTNSGRNNCTGFSRSQIRVHGNHIYYKIKPTLGLQ
jgi:hypothetical protein